MADHDRLRALVQGAQPARVVNKMSAGKLQQYMDVDTISSVIARWVRMAMLEKKL